jgi:hypothetical protein
MSAEALLAGPIATPDDAEPTTVDLWGHMSHPSTIHMQTSPHVSLNESTEPDELATMENLELFECIFGGTDLLEVQTEWFHDLANVLVRCVPAKGNMSRRLD